MELKQKEDDPFLKPIECDSDTGQARKWRWTGESFLLNEKQNI